MLTQTLFTHWIRIFEKIHGRSDMGTEALTVFYKSLEKEFNDELFERLAQKILDSERFFPVPATWRHYRNEEIKQKAEADWKLVLEAARRSRSLYEADLSEAIKVVILELGGLSVVSDCEIEKLDKLKRQFITIYREADLIKRLPPARGEKLWLNELTQEPNFIEAQKKYASK